MNNIKVIKRENQNTTKWSGGTTTQLYIYPEDSVYADRKFIFRLSSAVVEDEKSTFTSLVDYKRLIMILDGKLKLCHDDTESYTLDTFNQNYFDGASLTVSEGKVTDFNLMMRKNQCDGDIKALNISPASDITIGELIRLGEYNHVAYALYAYDSEVYIEIDNKMYHLDEKDMLLLHTDENNENVNIKIYNKENRSISLIYSRIKYK